MHGDIEYAAVGVVDLSFDIVDIVFVNAILMTMLLIYKTETPLHALCTQMPPKQQVLLSETNMNMTTTNTGLVSKVTKEQLSPLRTKPNSTRTAIRNPWAPTRACVHAQCQLVIWRAIFEMLSTAPVEAST
jgi:hypothetical protein